MSPYSDYWQPPGPWNSVLQPFSCTQAISTHNWGFAMVGYSNRGTWSQQAGHCLSLCFSRRTRQLRFMESNSVTG